MSELRTLISLLRESLAEWPKELIPVVANYLKISIHEWNVEAIRDKSVITKIDKMTIQTFMRRRLAEYVHYEYAQTKYSLGQGPRRWAIDITYYSQPLSQHMVIGISLLSDWRGQWAMIRSQQTPQRIVVEVDEPNGMVLIKISDLVTPDVCSECQLSFSEFYGTKVAADDLFLTLGFSTGACWATIVDEF
jgi:hypothetical protein